MAETDPARNQSSDMGRTHTLPLGIIPAQPATERWPESTRRRELRFKVNANIQIQLGKGLALFARATEVSRHGLRINLHAGAAPGQRYRVLLHPGAAANDSITAEVRWVGKRDLDGLAPVGLEWVERNRDAHKRVATFLRTAAHGS